MLCLKQRRTFSACMEDLKKFNGEVAPHDGIIAETVGDGLSALSKIHQHEESQVRDAIQTELEHRLQEILTTTGAFLFFCRLSVAVAICVGVSSFVLTNDIFVCFVFVLFCWCSVG